MSSRIEDGVVVGTTNKYEARNPIQRWLIARFDAAIGSLVAKVAPTTILEIGAGEGHITAVLLARTEAAILATDLSEDVLRDARAATRSERVRFRACSIYDIDPIADGADLVVCCEVLEHLPDPAAGLRIVADAAPRAVLSVPREPLFRGLNFLRGAYVSDFGNSPGHVQHWSKRRFVEFVSSCFEIEDVASPLPWTAVLARSTRWVP